VDRGTLLQDVPLHVSVLADITILYRALTHLTFGAVALLGKVEAGTATPDEEARLRLLTPTAKAYTSVKVPPAMHEVMATLGGLGYMEEVGIGRLVFFSFNAA
jgi:alkylation response protein AidB-like acyl-CoA dehydrogenase